MNTHRFPGHGLAAALFALALQSASSAAGLPDGLYAVFHTSRGVITAELFPQQAPLATAGFVGLAEGTIPFENRPAGKPFYDGLLFHRVVPGFVVQGGDPIGDGAGGPGYLFPDEFHASLRHVRGALAMANSGPNTNGSQFYFAIEPAHQLDYKNSVFGVVRSGMDVVAAIEPGDAIEHVEIIRAGDAARAFHPSAETFAALRDGARVLAPRDPSLPALFASEGVVLDLPEWYPQWIADKLNHYHRMTGAQIFVRLYPKFSALPAEEGGALPALHAALSHSDGNACLLVYLDDEQSWRLWFGNDVVPRLGIPAGDIDTEEGMAALHAAKTKALAAAKARIEAGSPGMSVDAAVTSLIEFLDNLPPPRQRHLPPPD